MSGREPAHLRAVVAPGVGIRRHGGPVGSPAVLAVPPPPACLHAAPAPAASDRSFEATRLRCRESARPQSPAPDDLVVALPTKASPLVVQWRRVRPVLERTEAWRSASSDCRAWIVTRRVPTFCRDRRRGTRWSKESVRPRESGTSGYTRFGRGAGFGLRARSARGRALAETAAEPSIRALPALEDLNSSENNDWTRFDRGRQNRDCAPVRRARGSPCQRSIHSSRSTFHHERGFDVLESCRENGCG